MKILTFEWQKELSVVMSIFWSNISYFIFGYSRTPFQFYFLSDLAGSIFRPNEVWQQSIYWMFQKHSCLSQSLQNKQRLPGTVCGDFFFLNPQFSFGEKGMCLYIFFVSWLSDLCSCLHMWFLNALSVYLSSSGMSQRLQMSRVFFPSMPTHLCVCLSSISVFTHTFMSTEGKITSIHLPGSAPEQSCRASSKLRFTVSVARATWDLGWAAGWRLYFHITASCLTLKYLDSEFPDQVCGGPVLPLALKISVQWSQTFWNKSGCWGHVLLLLPGTLTRRLGEAWCGPSATLLPFRDGWGDQRHWRSH